MDTWLKTSVWQQFGAAIDTLDDALRLCSGVEKLLAVWPHVGRDLRLGHGFSRLRGDRRGTQQQSEAR